MNIWIAQNVMFQAKSELAQWLMLGMSECDFFNSIPTFVHQMGKCQASASPVDLLVCGFTVCGATMLMSEYYNVPMVPFVLQPSAIPSKERTWRAIEPIASTTCCVQPCNGAFPDQVPFELADGTEDREDQPTPTARR